MPTTFNLITSTTLSSNAATVTLSGITGYTDLYIIGSKVKDSTNGTGIVSGLMRINANASSNYDWNLRQATTTVTDATTQSTTSIAYLRMTDTAASGYSPWEFYIFDYGTSNMKVVYTRTGAAGPSTSGMSAVSGIGLWNQSTAATSIYFAANANFVAGTRFYVYGITKA